MKTLLSIVFLAIFKLSYSQHCSCSQEPELKEVISCNPTIFKNKAKIFWQYNCDSAWLVFKSLSGKTVSLYSLQAGLKDMAERLGYFYVAEYKSTFLIQNNLISGCCTPPEFILFEKTNGKKRASLGRLIFFSEDASHPIVLYFQNNQSVGSDNTKSSFNNIILKNVNTNSTYKIQLPKGRIWSTLQFIGEMYGEHLIEEAKIIDNKLELIYRYMTEENGEWQTETISINLSKYGC